MTHEMVGEADFPYINSHIAPSDQAYISYNKKNIPFVTCPYCGKKNFMIKKETKITKLPWKCKASRCRKNFEINV